MSNPFNTSNREADLRKAVLKNNLRIPGSASNPGSGLLGSANLESTPSVSEPSSAWSWSSSEGSPRSALSPSGPSRSPGGVSTRLESTASPGSAEPVVRIQHFVFEPESPEPDWDEIADKQQMQRELDSPARILLNRYHSCANRETVAPTVDEIIALEASNEQLICAVRNCARSICFAANLSKDKNQDVDTAQALLNKWERCNGGPYEEMTPHMRDVVEQRSNEELVNMVRDAFADMDELLEDAKGDESGYPIVKAGVRLPSDGREWY